MAALMIPGGKLTDRWGRKRCFTAGLVVYGVGALLSAAAPGLGVLILGNSILEGVGTALLIPPVYILTTLLLTDLTSRARAFGVISAAGGVGGASGPLIGGLITEAIKLSTGLFRNRTSNLGLVTQNAQWLLPRGDLGAVAQRLQPGLVAGHRDRRHHPGRRHHQDARALLRARNDRAGRRGPGRARGLAPAAPDPGTGQCRCVQAMTSGPMEELTRPPDPVVRRWRCSAPAQAESGR
jgi:Major Facilitator Superfamily